MDKITWDLHIFSKK